ncbi:pfs domain-containing protein [Colletotrichum fioriniae PJ7]|uniref:Pfs domain-containing protein n=1 Tax=Colletotrichum fioriniae PJ7 TaxID=1445577 RepID=A0A010RLK9_9PEZI|nr:pfs domain-containing protein [Colletotrichum fioriniae PJ7]
MLATQQLPASTATIADNVKSCMLLLEECMLKAASIHPREVSLIENIVARFSVWVESIGVFSKGRASLDNRLREVHDVQDIVQSLLKALAFHLEDVSRILCSLKPPMASEYFLPNVDQELSNVLEEIGKDISLFHRFSNIIRRSSREKQNEKAASDFIIKDEEGTNAEPLLMELFEIQLRDRFRDANSELHKRLAKTMVLRRKKILYRRFRYEKKPKSVQRNISRPIVKSPDIPTSIKHLTTELEPNSNRQVPKKEPKGSRSNNQSIVRSSAPTATTLRPGDFQKAQNSSSSTISMSRTVVLSSQDLNQLPFPPSPVENLKRKFKRMARAGNHKVEETSRHEFGDPSTEWEKKWKRYVASAGEVICPFCFEAISFNVAGDENKWRNHVKGDIEPHQWSEHMQEHSKQWSCNSKTHDSFKTGIREEYMKHIEEDHRGKFSDAQVEVLADRNCRNLNPIFTSCPLCHAYGEDINDTMEDHIVRHLRLIALQSLPPTTDHLSEDTDSDLAQSSAVLTLRSRSTTREFEGKGALWDLDDIGLNSLDADSNHESPYQAFGGFRQYIQDYPQGLQRHHEENDSLNGIHSEGFLHELDLVSDSTTGVRSQSDRSANFVEGGLFNGLGTNDVRHFEWGFVLEGEEVLQSYQIAWIAGLAFGRAAAEAMLDEEHSQPKSFSRHMSDTNSYIWGRIGQHNIVIASPTAGVYGPGSAAATASRLFSTMPFIRVGLLVGIGGGIARPNESYDIRLGDVVVSQPNEITGGVCQYDLAKAKPGDNWKRKGSLATPPRVLLNAIADIRTAHKHRDSMIPHFLRDMLDVNPKMAKKTKKSPGYIHQGFKNDRLFQSSYEHVAGQDCRSCEMVQVVRRKERDSTDPEIHYGIIASGNFLVKDAISRDQIGAYVSDDCICIEVEAAGLMDHFPCLVIRGICDYADSHKSDSWQHYASATAAGYAKELLGFISATEIQKSKQMLEILQSGQFVLEVLRLNLVADFKNRNTQEANSLLANERVFTTHHTTRISDATVNSNDENMQTWEKMRTWLAVPDWSSIADEARYFRHPETGAWIFETTAYQNWISGTYKHLWLRGKAGCGKTVLSTRILDHLAQDKSIVLSFFFNFNSNYRRTRTKDEMLRSLAIQLYRMGYDSMPYLDRLFRFCKDGEYEPDTTSLEEVVNLMLAAQPKATIILDALDESTTRREVLAWLEDMFRSRRLEHVQFLYTSREEGEFLHRIPDLIGDQCCLRLDPEAIDADIRSYVISRTLRMFNKAQMPNDSLERIQTDIGNRANGMFSWAACQVANLANHKYSTDKKLQKALDELPFTLKSNLVSTIAVQEGREAALELHLAHFSVKQYLLFQMDFGRMDASIAITMTCLAYLRDIRGSFRELAETFPLAAYAAGCWMDFAAIAEASEDVATLIISFLHSEEALSRWSYLIETDLYGSNGLDIPVGSALYYACLGGLVIVTTSIIDTGIDVNAQKLLLERDADVNVEGGEFGTALQAASYNGRVDMVRLLLESNAMVDTQGAYGGNERIVKRLLGIAADINAPGGKFGSTLQAACLPGYKEILMVLVGRCADVDTKGGECDSPLYDACHGGNTMIANILRDCYFDNGLLVQLGAEVNDGSESGSALQTAISTMLFKLGADIIH